MSLINTDIIDYISKKTRGKNNIMDLENFKKEFIKNELGITEDYGRIFRNRKTKT